MEPQFRLPVETIRGHARDGLASLTVWGGFPNPPGLAKAGTSGLGNPLHLFYAAGAVAPPCVTECLN